MLQSRFKKRALEFMYEHSLLRKNGVKTLYRWVALVKRTTNMATVPPGVKEALLNLALTEITKSASNPAYEFLKTDLLSRPHHLYASLFTARECVEKSAREQSEEIPKPPLPPCENYEALTTCSDEDFKIYFRMNRKTIQSLTRIVEKRLSLMPDPVHPLVPVEKKVLLTAWLMGNDRSFMAAAKLFEISKGTVYRIFHQICGDLTILVGKYVQWPDAEESDKIVASFRTKFGFPGVIGVIGACHVEIREPESKVEANRFRNANTGRYTVILQAVCDDRLIFRDVCAGFPGETSKSRVLVESPLYARITSRTDPLIEPNKHILGGCDYPQLSTLLTPYTPTEAGQPLSPQQVKFNNLHQNTLSVIEKSFKVLKNRFQRLKFIDVSRTELASKVVVAACVLHNFAIMHGDYFEPSDDVPL